jgi:hypothetical protein
MKRAALDLRFREIGKPCSAGAWSQNRDKGGVRLGASRAFNVMGWLTQVWE